MITVKQYAEERGITIQAVHQSMKGKRKKDLLEGHVHMVEGVKWLDEEAVQILDEYRHKSPIVIEKAETDETIEELKLQIEKLLVKTAAQAERISELAQWKADNAMLIASAEQTKLALEAAQTERDELQRDYVQISEALEKMRDEASQRLLEAEMAEERELAAKQRAEAAEDALKDAKNEAKEMEDRLHLAEQHADQVKAKLEEVEKLPFWKKMFWHR